MRSAEFEKHFERLCTKVGRRVDAADEHARVDLYLSLFEDGTWRAEFLACLRLDPDEGMAGGVLSSLLELLTPEERLEVLGPYTADRLLHERARNLNLADTLLSTPGLEARDVDVTLVRALVEAPDWLQRRLVNEEVVPRWIYDTLAADARTRKVRARAAERARTGVRRA